MAFSGDEFRYINRTSVEGKLDASNPISVYHETGVCMYGVSFYGIRTQFALFGAALRFSLSLSLENKGNFSEEILLRKREFGALSLPAAAASPVCGSDIMSRPDLFSISVATKWSGKGRTHFYTSTSLLLPLFSQARKIFSSFCRSYCILSAFLLHSPPRFDRSAICQNKNL